MHELVAVIVPNHIVRKGHHTLPRKVDTAPSNRPQLSVFETPVLPVAVWTGKPRERPLPQRPVQIAADKEAGQALEKNFFHCIALPLNPPENLRLQRRLLRQRPQSRADENVPANRRRPLLPLRQRPIAAQGPRRTNVFGRAQPCIHFQTPFCWER